MQTPFAVGVRGKATIGTIGHKSAFRLSNLAREAQGPSG
jgi:hypothetical protein